jgi:magnesium chelatase family protein
LSGPLRDRIDLIVDVPAVPVVSLTAATPGESSFAIRARVLAARAAQHARYASTAQRTNGELRGGAVIQHCGPDEAGLRLLRVATERLRLTARGYDRVLKVARTIADLAASERVREEHVAEALQYRMQE